MQVAELPGLLALCGILSIGLGMIFSLVRPSKSRRLVPMTALLSLVFFSSAWVSLELTPFASAGVDLVPGLWLNRLSLSVSCLVALLSWVVTRYAVRYLDGDAVQTRFFLYAQFTVSMVLLMILSNHFLFLVVAWSGTGLGLNRLLRLHSDRPEALRTAQHKFIISRLGDVAIMGAAYFIWENFRSFHLPTIWSMVEAGQGGGDVIGILLVIAALTRSAQVPFHSWLPETLDTPTPVSALMHAGIINAGGYLILRTLPLVTPMALGMLGLFGFVSIVIAGLTMLATPDRKRQLALSTSAQMGFMFLQISFGLPTAGLMHMLGHAFYKAHCFLASGELSRFRQTQVNWAWGGTVASVSLLTLTLLPLLIYMQAGATMFTLGHAVSLSLSILALGSGLLLHATLAPSRGHIAVGALIILLAGPLLLALSHSAGSFLLSPPRPYLEAHGGILLLVTAGSIGLFVLQRSLSSWPAVKRWAFLTHARHGFYFHVMTQRLIGKVNHV
jgi:NAD(P)H-quinone oxidoreductase subunit 5